MLRSCYLLLAVCILSTAGWASSPPNSGAECVSPTFRSDYYQIKLVGTNKVRGARMAKGMTGVTFAQSPFGVALSESGTYVVNLELAMQNVTLDEGMSLVAWVSTPQIDQIRVIGRFDSQFKVAGSTDWNKFLVVITLEPKDTPLGATWTGPIVARGMSRSGLMHTLAGHGPYETEPCAVYGY
ncbi:MAG: hypothetical protein O3B41_05275 [Bacteroidetes bacterium]|nr:hypothetical protein [Bacteroidota bacterium]